MSDEPEDEMEEFELAEKYPPGPEVTREFLEWRNPRYGRSNPERMDNPVWEWLVRSRLSAYYANENFKGPDPFDAGPGWCFNRFGQCRTTLPDGRIFLIAGEHEDAYDPDFHIYNDLVIRHPDGRIEIFGYPREIFPPTDFQSATLVDDDIVLIGCLGYPHQRKPGTTPVLILNSKSLAIASVTTNGTPPGWIYKHTAQFAPDRSCIIISGGMIERMDGGSSQTVENIDKWRLHLDGWRWERMSEKNWPRWEFRRPDGKAFHLFWLEQATWAQQSHPRDKMEEILGKLEEATGARPNLSIYEARFRPPVAYESLPREEGEYRVTRIRVSGVVVRYVEDMHTIRLTIEGTLSRENEDQITGDLAQKLSALENEAVECKRL
jgi:hypothetical protein